MEAFLTLFGVVALAFASTNMDNLLLLVGWQLSRSASTPQLFGGYALGMFGVLVIAILIGLVGYLFPLEYLGYLGVVPIVLGLRLLLSNLRGKASETGVPETGVPEAVPVGAGVLALASVQLSNGVDTVLVFAPLLADSRLIFDAQIAALFVVLALLWFVLARVVGAHALNLPAVEKAGRWLAPLVMIGVGVYILGNTATDMG